MTKFREDGTRWKGGQLSYFLHVTQPSDTREDLYCLTLPQTEALIAVIEHWRFLTRWLDDDPDNSVTFARTDQFVNDIQRRLMMPCGSDNTIVISQFTPDGHYQESTDGGVTYHDVPSKDPRNNVTLPPPFLPEGTEEAECTYADSIVNQFINSWINATGEGEDTATVIAGILSFLAGILGAFGGVVAAIVLAIAISVVESTVVAWKAAFTTDVWDRFRCNLHDNQQSDGSFTIADVDAIYARLGDEETGIVLISLRQMVAALGWQGLTIAARNGVGSPTADCCENDGCWDTWDFYDGTSGNTVSKDSTTWVIDAEQRGDFNYYVIIVSSGAGDCCLNIQATDEGYSGNSQAWCGEDPLTVVEANHTNTNYGAQSVNGTLLRSASPFTVTWTQL